MSRILTSPEKYITGTYNLEILSLPRFYANDMNIIQSHTTTVEIPIPGIAVIQKFVKGYGSLFLEKDGELEWIYTFRDTDQPQESLVLMPGIYRAVFRSRYVNRSSYYNRKIIRSQIRDYHECQIAELICFSPVDKTC